MKILYVNNDGGGFADTVEVDPLAHLRVPPQLPFETLPFRHGQMPQLVALAPHEPGRQKAVTQACDVKLEAVRGLLPQRQVGLDLPLLNRLTRDRYRRIDARGDQLVPVEQFQVVLDAEHLRRDRNFGVFGFFHAAVAAGHDVLTRLTKTRFRALKRLAKSEGRGRWSLCWKPTKCNRQTDPSLPAAVTVSVWLHEFKGFSGQII